MQNLDITSKVITASEHYETAMQIFQNILSPLKQISGDRKESLELMIRMEEINATIIQNIEANEHNLVLLAELTENRRQIAENY